MGNHSRTGFISGLILLLILSSVGSCGRRIPVRRQFDRNVDFDQYRTFGWVSDPGQSLRLPEWLAHTIEESVRRKLHNEGFTEGNGAADLLVSYELKRELKTVWQKSFNSRGLPTFRPRTFDRGTEVILRITLLDRSSNRVVWSGNAALPPTSNVKKTQKAVQRAVAKLLRRFPP